MTTTRTYYSEQDIRDHVVHYAYHHSLEIDQVDVSRATEDGTGLVIGFRLSPKDGHTGDDERFGEF